jgi:hypothetical protein
MKQYLQIMVNQRSKQNYLMRTIVKPHQLYTIALIIIFGGCFPSIAHSMSGRDHAGDMVEVLTGDRSSQVPDLRAMCLSYTATIDNFEVIKGIPVGADGHRIYGHWGFSDSIPFNKSPLRDVLDKVESDALRSGKSAIEAKAAREATKTKIIDSWKNDVTKMSKLVENETGLIGQQAKGLAGLFYDIHILGDWSGVKLATLQSVDDLGRDIVKNLHRFLGNNSQLPKEIEMEIKKISKFCLNDSACRANGILDILKRSDELRYALSLKLAEKYPIVSKIVNSKPLWRIALTLSAATNRYNTILNKIPEKLRQPAQAGLISGVISATISGYQVIQGDISVLDAVVDVTSNSFLSAQSIYISDAILIKIGNKYALQTVAESTSSNLCKGFGAALNLGLATFIFDESKVIFTFCKGDISETEFYKETSKTILRTSGSYAAAYCSVAIGLSPTGPVVMAIAIGSYMLTDLAINKYEQWEARKYITIDDLIGQLPIKIKFNKSIIDTDNIYDNRVLSIDMLNNNSVLEIDKIKNNSIIDPEAIKGNDKTILDF